MNLHHLFAEHVCPVCGFQLDFMPWADTDHAAQICPCCAIHFGYDDLTAKDRETAYAIWRRRWIEFGKRWSTDYPVPADYDPDKQLARLDYLCGDSQKLAEAG